MHTSYWLENKNPKPRQLLVGDIQTPVAIVGGGLCGILTSFHLKEMGIENVVLEAKRCGFGASGHSTAKITSQHRLIYDEISRTKLPSQAKFYFRENEKAIDEFENIIKKKKIDCDFERLSSFVYAENSDEMNQISNEMKTLHMWDVDARVLRECELPIKIEGALEFRRQAKFNPYKFIRALARELEVYENTPVLSMEDNILETPNGRVRAEKIMICTQYPIFNLRGGYFLKLQQRSSNVIELKDTPKISAMYSGVNPHSNTFRQCGETLFMGGVPEIAGQCARNSAIKMQRRAKEIFKDPSISGFWHTQDCVTGDNLPLVGRLHKKMPDVFVATGFNKWGMTTSMVAAKMLAKFAINSHHVLEDLLCPSRVSGVLKLSSFVLNTAKGYTLAPDSEKRCSHMKGPLKWNELEKTWDCPCHGSRFTPNGEIVNSPAIEPI